MIDKMECECYGCTMRRNIKLTKQEQKLINQVKIATEIVMIEDKKLMEELAKH